MQHKKIFGLVGRNIAYSFSRKHFSEKFEKLQLTDHSYQNFDLKEIGEFPGIFEQYKGKLVGLNVTIPYKEEVGAFLDAIDADAKEIGAINTIKVAASGKTTGYNTDVIGFANSIKPLLKKHHTKALILGTGGASKAVAYAFKKMNIDYKFVSRTPKNEETISYAEIDKALLLDYTILVNCSPLGTSPNTHLAPNIPYEYLNDSHLLYDLIYNPAETTFLSRGKSQGAAIKNGLEMLVLQAEKSWEIWNE